MNGLKTDLKSNRILKVLVYLSALCWLHNSILTVVEHDLISFSQFHVGSVLSSVWSCCGEVRGNNSRWWSGLISVNHINRSKLSDNYRGHLYTTDWVTGQAKYGPLDHSIILHGFQYFKLDGLFSIFCQLQLGGGWWVGSNLLIWSISTFGKLLSLEENLLFFLIIIISW